MDTNKLRPQYLRNESGEKSFVVLTVAEHEELLDDLSDLAVLAERKDDPKVKLKDFENGLKADGLI